MDKTYLGGQLSGIVGGDYLSTGSLPTPALPDGIDAINQNLSGQNNRLYAVFERLERIANRLHGVPLSNSVTQGAPTPQAPQATPICTRDWLGAMASLIDKIENQIHRIQPDA